MKIASRIVLLVGGIIGFLNAALFFIYSIIFTVFSTPALAGVIRENIENGTINVSNAEDVETALMIVTIIFIVFAVWFFLWGVISLVSAILTFKARQYHEKNRYVVGIVFNAIGCNPVAIAGCVLGLIWISLTKKDDVIDMTK